MLRPSALRGYGLRYRHPIANSGLQKISVVFS